MIKQVNIAILDYGMGNLRSVAKAFEHVGAAVNVTADEQELRRADGLVIVGVGAFPEAMRRLSPFRRVLLERKLEETPILGICLGLQLLFEASDEHEGSRGLGFLEGGVHMLEAGAAKLPHIGWNRVRWEQSSDLLEGIPDECAFYHAHSYVAQPSEPGVILGTSEYGERFVSAVQRGSLFGVQFHPEKSSTHGLKLLENFSRTCLGTARSTRPAADRNAQPGLCKRIIPCLDVADGRVVKGTNFLDLRDAGDPVEMAELYDSEGADEIVFLDITATHEKRDTVVELAERAVSQVFVPIAIGGGIRTVADAHAILNAGADKISVNSAAVDSPDLLDDLSSIFGNQNIILAIDAKRREDESGWEVYVAGGRTPTDKDAVAWALEGAERGAGEILLTSMDRDGTKSGYDNELIRAVSEAAPVPVIASGGAGTLEHLAEALRAGADAVLLASILHYGQHSIAEAKEYLAQQGIRVRV